MMVTSSLLLLALSPEVGWTLHYGNLVAMTNADLGVVVVVRICGLSKVRRSVLLARADAVAAIA